MSIRQGSKMLAGFIDTEYIANLAMPDWLKMYDITLPASGTYLTAPQDGYFCIVLDVSANSYLAIGNNYYQMGNTPGYVGGLVPVQKGYEPYITYSNRLNTIICCFVPAGGAL